MPMLKCPGGDWIKFIFMQLNYIMFGLCKIVISFCSIICWLLECKTLSFWNYRCRKVGIQGLSAEYNMSTSFQLTPQTLSFVILFCKPPLQGPTQMAAIGSRRFLAFIKTIKECQDLWSQWVWYQIGLTLHGTKDQVNCNSFFHI